MNMNMVQHYMLRDARQSGLDRERRLCLICKAVKFDEGDWASVEWRYSAKPSPGSWKGVECFALNGLTWSGCLCVCVCARNRIEPNTIQCMASRWVALLTFEIKSKSRGELGAKGTVRRQIDSMHFGIG